MADFTPVASHSAAKHSRACQRSTSEGAKRINHLQITVMLLLTPPPLLDTSLKGLEIRHTLDGVEVVTWILFSTEFWEAEEGDSPIIRRHPLYFFLCGCKSISIPSHTLTQALSLPVN